MLGESAEREGRLNLGPLEERLRNRNGCGGEISISAHTSRSSYLSRTSLKQRPCQDNAGCCNMLEISRLWVNNSVTMGLTTYKCIAIENQVDHRHCKCISTTQLTCSLLPPPAATLPAHCPSLTQVSTTGTTPVASIVSTPVHPSGRLPTGPDLVTWRSDPTGPVKDRATWACLLPAIRASAE